MPRVSVLLGVLLAYASALAVSAVAADRTRRPATQRGLRAPRAGEGDTQSRYGPGGLLPRKYTQEDFNRWAHDAAPKRLTSAQLDPQTGFLAWPRTLLDEEYAEERRVLDRLFEERARLGGAIGNRMYADISQNIDQMRDRLKETIGYVHGARQVTQYLKARNFLESLAYETDFEPAEVEAADAQDAANLARN